MVADYTIVYSLEELERVDRYWLRKRRKELTSF